MSDDARPNREEQQDQEQYEHVSIIKTLGEDPVNEVPEDHIWFIEGSHHNGDDYRVMTDEGHTLVISTETVAVIELPEALSRDKALNAAREKAKEIVVLAEKYKIGSEGNDGK